MKSNEIWGITSSGANACLPSDLSNEVLTKLEASGEGRVKTYEQYKNLETLSYIHHCGTGTIKMASFPNTTIFFLSEEKHRRFIYVISVFFISSCCGSQSHFCV